MIICVGSAMVDCIVTDSGTLSVADDIILSPGGEAFNESVILSRLGEEVVLYAAVGKDLAGHALKKILYEEQVRLCSNYLGHTPVSLLLVDENGERRSRISQAHSLGEYQPEILCTENVSFVTMASMFRPPFLTSDSCAAFTSKAKRITGARLLADIKLPKGIELKLSNYTKALSQLDFVTPNEQEAFYYTGKDNVQEAAEIWKLYGVRNVIIKMGNRGCYVLPEKENPFFVSAYKMSCVDGIGAGDAFNAGLMHALSHGKALRQAVRFATACAAISVTGRGATSAVQSDQQIAKFLALHKYE